MKIWSAVALSAVMAGAGWIAGSLFPAPLALTATVRDEASRLAAEFDIDPATIERLRASLSPEEFQRLGEDAAELAGAAGRAIIVERDPQAVQDAAETGMAATLTETSTQLAPEAQAETAAAPLATDGLFTPVRLCPRMEVSNQPMADAEGLVFGGVTRVNVQGVAVAVNPTRTGCFASGFGPRNGRIHKGIDLHSADGGPILAGADGVVIEKKYRDDYGNMLLIDHGAGVYTRYAHLASFAPEMAVGARVQAGREIGLMGNSAGYRIPIHLHYELLLGDYNNPKGSFGLTPRSPFEFPAAG